MLVNQWRRKMIELVNGCSGHGAYIYMYQVTTKLMCSAIPPCQKFHGYTSTLCIHASYTSVSMYETLLCNMPLWFAVRETNSCGVIFTCTTKTQSCGLYKKTIIACMRALLHTQQHPLLLIMIKPYATGI